jgi:hypothetical protein
MTYPADSPVTGPATPPTGAECDTPEAIEVYEDDGHTVFFDEENPLAWVEASHTVTLSDLV